MQIFWAALSAILTTSKLLYISYKLKITFVARVSRGLPLFSVCRAPCYSMRNSSSPFSDVTNLVFGPDSDKTGVRNRPSTLVSYCCGSY